MHWMGIENPGTFVLAVLVLLALPGAGTFALLAATGRDGPRAGLATLGGLLLGDQIVIVLALAGVAAVLKANPMLFQALKLAGAVYILWLGLRLWWPPRATDGAAVRPSARHFRQGLAVSLLNPKAILFYMLFLPMFVDPHHHRGLATFATMAALILVMSIVYCTVLILLGHAIARRLHRRPRTRRALQWLAGACLIGFGLRLALGDPR